MPRYSALLALALILACSAPPESSPQRTVGPEPIMGGFAPTPDAGEPCDDGNDCTDDAPADGGCAFTFRAKGSPCIGGACFAGSCCDPSGCLFVFTSDAGGMARTCIAKCPPGMICSAIGVCE